MNRLLVLLAVSLLGTGCVVRDTCDIRTVSVGWPSFHRADGATVGCADAGVRNVDVWVDGGSQPAATVPCSAGGVEIDVASGPHEWVIEGVNTAGAIVNRDTFTTNGDDCGVLVRDTQPAAGYVDLSYRFVEHGAPLADQTCAGDWLWVSIFDKVANQAAVLVDQNSFPQTYTCGDPYPFVLPLPVGSYTFDWMEERGAANGYALLSADCSAQDFTVFPGDGGNGTQVPIDLETTATAACIRP